MHWHDVIHVLYYTQKPVILNVTSELSWVVRRQIVFGHDPMNCTVIVLDQNCAIRGPGTHDAL